MAVRLSGGPLSDRQLVQVLSLSSLCGPSIVQPLESRHHAAGVCSPPGGAGGAGGGGAQPTDELLLVLLSTTHRQAPSNHQGPSVCMCVCGASSCQTLLSVCPQPTLHQLSACRHAALLLPACSSATHNLHIICCHCVRGTYPAVSLHSICCQVHPGCTTRLSSCCRVHLACCQCAVRCT